MAVTRTSLDLLALSSDGFHEWLQKADQIQQKLFGLPLGPKFRSRNEVVFFRTMQYHDGDELVGHSYLYIVKQELFDPLKGKKSNVLIATGAGEVLLPYIGTVNLHSVLPKFLVLFHLTKGWRFRSINIYMFSLNLNPIVSYLFAKHFPMVHPFPGKENEPFEQLNRKLVPF